jgi:glycosyltransferase involved in cell wall biosynthesis
MKIAIIGPGLMPIPPVSWGAVEILIWNYRNYLMKKGHEVKIYNTKDLLSVKKDIEQSDYDVVHLHFDNYLQFFEDIKCKKFFVTSHYGNLPTEKHYEDFYWKIFYNFIRTKHHILALSPEIKAKYESYGVSKHRVSVAHNGVEIDDFEFSETAKKPERTIYFGRLEKRKGQHLFCKEAGFNFDFVGNKGDITSLDLSTDNKYLGAWEKTKVYSDLTNYANMALISYGEAHPLVCMESMAAGLGVVVSNVAAANLDRSKPFISVVPDDKIEDIDYVREKVVENRQISIKMRKEIREYAREHFSWDNVVDKYLRVLNWRIDE